MWIARDQNRDERGECYRVRSRPSSTKTNEPTYTGSSVIIGEGHGFDFAKMGKIGQN